MFSPLWGTMDWIGCGSEYTWSSWIGLDWVSQLVDWVGLDLANGLMSTSVTAEYAVETEN